jgi:hypothetical protein
MMSSDHSSLDRLAELYAGCRLGYASQDDLFAALIEARAGLKKPNSENPADAYLAGFDHRARLQEIPNSRRAEVAEAFKAWLPHVLAIPDNQMTITLGMWASRAKAARSQHADKDRRVRA